MSPFEALVNEFLAQRRIAVVGVSRDPRQTANLVYRKLRDSGHEVVPINPHATSVEGADCYPNLKSSLKPIGAVMIVTRPEAALEIVRDCVALDIRHVWMHRSFGAGSVSDEAARWGREHGMHVIAGACPMMFCSPVDPAHRCLRWVLGMQGKLRA
jgi:hypothetical protein